MTSSSDFDLLRQWASKLAEQYRSHGGVQVIESQYSNGGLTVHVDLSRTLAQVILWTTGMLEIRVIDIRSGADVAMESHQLEGRSAFCEILKSVEILVQKTQVGK